MRAKQKCLLSVLLTLCMVLAMVPAMTLPAFAAEDEIPAPTGLTWEGSIAKWEAVPSATTYSVLLLCSEHSSGSMSQVGWISTTGTETTLDLGAHLHPGMTYQFQVRALVNTVQGTLSGFSAKKTIDGSLGTVSNIAWGSGEDQYKISWDEFVGATGYTVWVKRNGIQVNPGARAQTVAFIDITDDINREGYGTYSIDVYAGTNIGGGKYINFLAKGSSTGYTKWPPAPGDYKVSFYANGGTGTMDAQTFEYNVDQKLNKNTFTREGYTFTGWKSDLNTLYSDEEIIKILGNTTLSAQWTKDADPGTYTVTFNTNGGSVTPASSVTGTDGKLAGLPTPTRPDHTFNGWFTATTGGAKVTTDTVFENNTTIYAQWTANTPITKTVSVGGQTGSLTTGTAGNVTYTVTTTNIDDGTYTATLGDAPDGVTAGDVEISSNTGTLTVNTTTATPAGTHPLTLTIDGATSASFDLVVGEAAPVTVESISIKTSPTKTTYTEGENLDLTGLEVMLNKSDSTTENVSLAQFGSNGLTASPENGTKLTTTHAKVTISHTSGQTAEFDITVAPAAVTVTDVTVTPSSTIVQKGETQTFNGLVNFSNGTVNYLVTWSVTGNNSTDTEIDSTTGKLTVAADETATSLIVTATSNQDNGKSGTATVTVTEAPVTKYTLTVNNGTGGDEYAENAEITIVADTAPEDKEFDKWTSDVDGVLADENSASTTVTMPGEDVTVTATYKDKSVTPATYTISFAPGEGSGTMSNEAATEGVAFTLPDSSFTAPSDKVFKAWSIDGTEYAPGVKYTFTADTTVTALWRDSSVITYTVSISGGGSGATGGGSYEESDLVTIYAGNRSNYTFNGWTSADVTITNASSKTASFTMPGKNVSVTANWTYSGGGGGGSDSGDDSTTTTPPATSTAPDWLEQGKTSASIAEAKASGHSYALTRANGQYGVRAAAWAAFSGYQYWHDTMDGNAVQVRVYVTNPAAITTDLLVSGYVTGAQAQATTTLFEKYFSNKVRTIHLDQTGAWGQTVELAARVDLAGMDITKLMIYSYDKTTNTYRRIEKPAYWVDKNGYLHFTTPYAGNIVISEGALALIENGGAK